jgi:hypothetical protein
VKLAIEWDRPGHRHQGMVPPGRQCNQRPRRLIVLGDRGQVFPRGRDPPEGWKERGARTCSTRKSKGALNQRGALGSTIGGQRHQIRRDVKGGSLESKAEGQNEQGQRRARASSWVTAGLVAGENNKFQPNQAAQGIGEIKGNQRKNGIGISGLLGRQRAQAVVLAVSST